jgi:hypothetical protein
MSIFSWFSKDSSLQRRRETALKKLTNMFYQTLDRRAAAQDMARLAADGDQEAVLILLRRFEHIAPNHFVDQDEKELVHNLLVELGDLAVPTIRSHIRKTGQPVYWALRALTEIEGPARVRTFLAELLRVTDNGYWRDPQKKHNLVQAAVEVEDDAICEALIPFLEDHHEDIRYVALDALLRFKRIEAREPLLARLAGEEESQRLQQRLLHGFVELGWPVTELTDALQKRLPRGYKVSESGAIVRA